MTTFVASQGINEFRDMPFGHTNVPLRDTKDILVSNTPHVDITLLVPQGSSLRCNERLGERYQLLARSTLGQFVRGWLNLQTPDYIELSEVFINEILVSL